MVNWVLPQVIAVNRAVTRPVIEKKTGLKVVSSGEDFGQIVTNVDIGVSNALLNGGIQGVEGLRSRYPGSFSEEQDSPVRRSSLEIYEVDPIDGTGDFQKTYNTPSVMSPTTLVTKLIRESVDDPFRPVAGMIFEIVNQYAIIGDGTSTGLFVAGKDGVVQIPIQKIPPSDVKVPLRINRRFSYPQDVYDNEFPKFLESYLYNVQQVAVGGAGMQALQFFRSIFEPADSGAEAFSALKKIDVIFNCQPDWKTWDTDPAMVIARAWDCVLLDNIENNYFVSPPNAAAEKMTDMWHRHGCRLGKESWDGVMTTPYILGELARTFRELGNDLLSKNY
jgi:hypothetical protein